MSDHASKKQQRYNYQRKGSDDILQVHNRQEGMLNLPRNKGSEGVLYNILYDRVTSIEAPTGTCLSGIFSARLDTVDTHTTYRQAVCLGLGLILFSVLIILYMILSLSYVFV